MRAETRIHNISDRGEHPMALHVGNEKIRPGKSALVDSSLITKKLRILQGSQIWIGDVLPGKYRRRSKSALDAKVRALSQSAAPAMDLREARAYLEHLSEAELLHLCDAMTPALEFTGTPVKRVLVARLGRVMFTDRVLDPEAFFWLRRWVLKGDVYIERD